MYVPKYFRVDDNLEIEKFISENGFATLITGGEFPAATHIPIALENEAGEKVLRGHIARANPQWKSFESNPNVLVVFLSHVNHYISSSWYDHQNVSTWNYMSVHVSGKIKIIEGKPLYEMLTRLTAKYETVSANPSRLDSLPADYVDKQMKAIVGFEVSVEKIEASYKLSQNRDEKNLQNIIRELELLNDHNATEMAKQMSALKKGAD
ncbi:MAG: FMN-binding negative transcriptional regulator [Bacteroidota bacterium]